MNTGVMHSKQYSKNNHLHLDKLDHEKKQLGDEKYEKNYSKTLVWP